MQKGEQNTRAIGALIGALVGLGMFVIGGVGALVLVGAFVGSLIGGFRWRKKHPHAPAAEQE
jgi:uncharacterized protein YqgC (DUF456 family)